MLRWTILALALGLAGCGGGDAPDGGAPARDAGTRDAGAPREDAGGRRDAGARVDAGAGADAGARTDSGPVPDAGPRPDGGAASCWVAEVTTVGAGVHTGTTAGASSDFTSLECDGLGPDQQIRFTAPSAGSYTFVVTSDAMDPSISLHDPDCSNPKELACADDTGDASDATASAVLAAGASILVNVDGLGETDSGEYTLNVARIDDTCPDQDLGSTTGAPAVTGATIDTSTLDHRHAPCTFGGGGRDLSYRFTATGAGDYDFAVVNATFDSVLYVLEDDCAGDVLQCNDDSFVPTEDSAVRVTLDAGQSVIVVVEGFTSTEVGTFDLNVAGPL